MCAERTHLTHSQLIGAALDRPEFVKHFNTAFTICRGKIPQTEQAFIPVGPKMNPTLNLYH